MIIVFSLPSSPPFPLCYYLMSLLFSSLLSWLFGVIENVKRIVLMVGSCSQCGFKVVPSENLGVLLEIGLLGLHSPLPSLGKNARLFLGSIPSVSTASWLLVYQEQNNLE